VATQLTRRRIRTALSSELPVVRVSPAYLVAGAAACIAIAYAALFLSVRDARDDRDVADARYADARTLLEVPPGSLAALQGEAEAARAALAASEGRLHTSIDLSAGQSAGTLVRAAQDAGLTVVALASVEPAQSRIVETAYDVRSIRLTLEGTLPELTGFLRDLDEREPALIASLSSLSLSDAAVARAEIAFSTYARAEATPAAGGAP
jgi:hypothetical protein